MLLQCAFACILPARAHGVALGGLGAPALFVDADGAFDALHAASCLKMRVHALLTQAPKKHRRAPDVGAGMGEDAKVRVADRRDGDGALHGGALDEAVDAIVAEALGRLTVMTVTSPLQLVCTLMAMHATWPGEEGGGGAGRGPARAAPMDDHAGAGSAAPAPLGDATVALACRTRAAPRLLIIDSISRYQWLARSEKRHWAARPDAADVPAADAGARAAENARPAEAPPPSDESFVAAALRALLGHHRLCAAWSRCPTASRAAGAEFPFLDAPDAPGQPDWASLATHRIYLRRPRAAPPHAAAHVAYHAAHVACHAAHAPAQPADPRTPGSRGGPTSAEAASRPRVYHVAGLPADLRMTLLNPAAS